MKFKTFELNAYKSRAGITLSFDKKDRGLGIITSKLFYLDSKHPLKLKITNNQAERYHIKQEIKQTDYKGCVTEGVMTLADIIEEKIILMDCHNANKENFQDWMRVFVYGYLYDVAFNRGIRHERQRRKTKHKAMTAFDIISSEDVSELSNELGISEDKLTYAVMEVISKRKNGGMA